MIVRNRTWPIGQSPDERVRQRTLPVAGGDGATVSFDFVGMGGVLDSRWTFSRAAGSGFLAGTGPTYIGADGLVKYATTNQPRFDYDPTTRLPRGLLIEGTATNRLFQSSAFSTSPWSPTNYTFAGLGYTSPDGVTLAQRWTVDTGALSPGNVQACTNVTSTSVTLSIWWRNGNHTNSTSNNLRRVAIRNSTTATILLDVSIINPATTPSISYNTGSSGASLTQYQDGWYRLVMTVSSGITSGNTIQAYVGGLFGAVTGAGEFCYWWGAQLEDGSGASSYIPTGSATGTREQDTASFADAAAIGFDRRKGTLYFSGTQFKHASGFARSVRLAAAPGGVEPMGIAVSGSTFYGTARDASSVAFGDAIRTNTLLQPFAFAVAFNADTPSSVLRGSLNGSSVSVTQSSAAAPPTSAAVSMDLNSGSSATAYASMAIRSVKFWPTDKTLSELTSITS